MQVAAFGLGPCLILTLWMAGSSAPATVPPRTPDSSPFWDQASIPLQKKALQLRKAGDFGAAAELYQQGYAEAVRLGDKLAAVCFLISVGGCQFGQFHYQEALATFLQARGLARAIQDGPDLGAIAVNLSSLYFLVWDISAATRAADDGLAELSKAATAKHPHSYFETPLLMQLGRLHAMLGDSRAQQEYAAGIEAAQTQGNDTTTEALAWDLLGELRLDSRDFAGAEKAFLEAFRRRALYLPTETGLSFGRLAALELARGGLDAAARENRPSAPEYRLLHLRGRIRFARGQIAAALQDFSQAVDATAQWRLQVPAARSALLGADAGLDEQIYRSYIEAAAKYALRSGSRDWARKAFQAVELNRAASLREGLVLAEAWQKNLPPEYWEVLGQVSAEEAQRLRNPSASSRTAGLYLKLTEMEAEAGRGLSPKIDENFRSQTSPIHFRNGLRASELFLSFWLGRSESYLWTLDRDTLRLYRLPAKQEIENAVRWFREALSSGGPEAVQQGQRLYALLFGQLGPRETQKTAWLLSLEGALFDVPFAALATTREDGGTAYLVESHSLQTVPGALLLRSDARRASGPFLGVGDPIYNTADARWHGPHSASDAGGQLDRLVGSGKEVEASARGWGAEAAGGGQSGWTLLQGSKASRGNFLRQMESRPAAIHLATHVLIPPQDREQGFIAFSLTAAEGGSPRAEFLSASEIATLRAPGSLVVMTGCASGTGTVRAGAGLLGLTRAWLMAGASTVVATAWPVEDTSGEFFGHFYRYLREHTAAEALRRSQLSECASSSAASGINFSPCAER